MTQGPASPPGAHKGIIPWFARNRVAANLLMLVLLVGGALMMPAVQREVFPQVDLDMIIVEAIYPGASPEEVEQGVIFAVEEAIRGVENVKRILAVADEARAEHSPDLHLAMLRHRREGDEDGAEIHARFRQDRRIDDGDVGHRQEGGEAGQHLGLHVGAVFVQLEVVLKHSCPRIGAGRT